MSDKHFSSFCGNSFWTIWFTRRRNARTSLRSSLWSMMIWFFIRNPYWERNYFWLSQWFHLWCQWLYPWSWRGNSWHVNFLVQLLLLGCQKRSNCGDGKQTLGFKVLDLLIFVVSLNALLLRSNTWLRFVTSHIIKFIY